MKKKNQWLFPVLLVLIIAVTSALPVLLGKSGKETEKETSIRTAKAERKDIAATLSGTGTLVSQDPLDVEIPSGVEVTEYLVSNGDTVKKGQLLARVDPVSVQEAISACQETIDYLEDRMYALEYHQSTRYITVPETGTVKAIYCKPGDKVADVMLEYGCLGIIEINGEEWKAQAFNGTVKFINATEGSTVYHSHTFIMLDDLAETSEYDTLLAQHQKYESIMEQLAAMYRDEAIFSPGDGIVDGIAEEEDEADQDAETKELLDKLTELEEQGKKNDRRKPDFPNMTENGEFPQMPEGFSPDSMTEMPEGFRMDTAPQIPGNTTAQQPVLMFRRTGNVVRQRQHFHPDPFPVGARRDKGRGFPEMLFLCAVKTGAVFVPDIDALPVHAVGIDDLKQVCHQPGDADLRGIEGGLYTFRISVIGRVQCIRGAVGASRLSGDHARQSANKMLYAPKAAPCEPDRFRLLFHKHLRRFISTAGIFRQIPFDTCLCCCIDKC